MALATDKLIFLHIPKTGGVFFRHIFKVCGISTIELGEQHSHFPELLRYKPPEFFQQRKIITFVRHPLTWYQSRWAFRVKHGWKAQHPLDYNCASNDFPTFVDNVLKYQPNGWFSWECRMFIDNAPKIDFVGRTESLIEDSIAALKLAGEKFNEKIIRSIQRTNDSDMDGKTSKHWAQYDPSLMRRLMAVEQEVVKRYYSNFDPKILCGPCPY